MIGYIAANDGALKGLETDTAAGIMKWTGNNVGNLAFWYTTKRLIDEDVTFLTWDVEPASLPKGLKALVIPAANFVGAHMNLTLVTRIVTELNIPTIVVGLGAQSEREDTLPEVNDSVRQFLHEVSKRSPFIGVRGEYSAKACRALGISNVKALGCPSILMNSDQSLGKLVEQKISQLVPDNVAVHAACRKGNLMNVERELARLMALRPGSAYVVQAPLEAISVICREAARPNEAAYNAEMASFLGMPGGTDELIQFLTRHGYVPTSIDSWRSYLRKFSCSINTRIHGTVVAFESGVPALCIHHDTRTRELAVQMKLPNLSISDFIENRYDIKRQFAATKFDGKTFDENRQQVAAEYRRLLETVGLKPSAHLMSFINYAQGTLAKVA